MHARISPSKENGDKAEGLQNRLVLMDCARVILTRNLWTAEGLTNGTMDVIGTLPIYYFLTKTNSTIFAPDQRPHVDIPFVIVMVAIPSYRSPAEEWHIDERAQVPSVPIVTSVATLGPKWQKLLSRTTPFTLLICD